MNLASEKGDLALLQTLVNAGANVNIAKSDVSHVMLIPSSIVHTPAVYVYTNHWTPNDVRSLSKSPQAYTTWFHGYTCTFVPQALVHVNVLIKFQVSMFHFTFCLSVL